MANEVLSEWSPTAQVVLFGGEPYRAWADTILWNGADSTPDADANGDGLSNFRTYASGGDPLASSSALRPYVGLGRDTDGNEEIEFTFR